MGLKQRSEKLFRGWLPKEPLLEAHSIKPMVKTEQDEQISRQLIKWVAITNSIIGPIVFAANDFAWKSFAVSFFEFALVSIVTNVAIYLYLRRRIYRGT